MSWHRLAIGLLRLLPRDYRNQASLEITSTLAEVEADTGVSHWEVGSIALLVVRRWGRTLMRSLPLVLAGLPFAVFVLVDD